MKPAVLAVVYQLGLAADEVALNCALAPGWLLDGVRERGGMFWGSKRRQRFILSAGGPDG
jgi:hypothetical protein